VPVEFGSSFAVQADNGEGLTQGVIGLVNKGQPRKIDDWGALRAWAGHSRYGKAALVAMAYDPRFAIAYYQFVRPLSGDKRRSPILSPAPLGWVGRCEGHVPVPGRMRSCVRLLGRKDLGTREFPPIEMALIDGDLAFRQHGGGHTPAPNWPRFLTFAERYLKEPLLSANPKH
jgi:hypothetical protein